MDQIRHLLRNENLIDALEDRRVLNTLELLDRLAREASEADVVPMHRVHLFEAMLTELVRLLRANYGIRNVESLRDSLQGQFQTRIAS